jgi:hypothetical protein
MNHPLPGDPRLAQWQHNHPVQPIQIDPLGVPGGGGRGPGNMSRNIATQRNVSGKEIPSLGQSGKVVTSPAADRALTKLGGKNVDTGPGPTVKSGSTNVQLDPAAEVPAYVRQGKPDPVTTPVGKPKIQLKPGETMDQAVQRTKDEQEFGKFLQGQGGQTFGTPGAGRGGQGGPTAAQATSGSNQVPTIKLPNGQTIPDPARVSPSGNYNTPSDSKMDQIMKKWDQENSPVQSKGQRPWGSNVDDQPGSVRPSNTDSKGGPASWLGGGAPESKNTDSTLSKLLGLDEQSRKKQPPEANYDDEYDAMVARVRKLAGLGPMKTVYDPAKRVYKNVPKADQPQKK